MGFNINETITTKLHYTEITLIVVAIGIYQDQYKYTADKDILDRMRSLVDRLWHEMANCLQDDVH